MVSDTLHLGVCHLVINAKINILLHLLKGHRRCTTSFLNFLLNSVVNSAVDSLVLDEVVETLLVSLNSEVCLNVVLTVLNLLIV